MPPRAKRKRDASDADGAEDGIKQKLRLRDIPDSRRYFWTDTSEQQFALAGLVQDQNPDYEARPLVASELTALALQEIAAERRRGLFYHLPSIDQWKKSQGGDRLPAERTAGMPNIAYPALLYAKFSWDEDCTERYFSESHRGRYLLTSGIMNPPPPSTPLFRLQLVSRQHSPVFVAGPDDVVLYQVKTPPSFYLARASTLLALLGPLRGADAKVSHASFLWRPPGSPELPPAQQGLSDAMQQYRLDSLEQVYDGILRLCCPVIGSLSPTLTASDLKFLLPRPDPMRAASVGTPLGQGVTGEPHSRRRERRTHKKARWSATEEDDSNDYSGDREQNQDRD